MSGLSRVSLDGMLRHAVRPSTRTTHWFGVNGGDGDDGDGGAAGGVGGAGHGMHAPQVARQKLESDAGQPACFCSSHVA